MEKLTIIGRTNQEDKFYIKFKAEKNSMKIIRKIVEEIGDEYFADRQSIPKSSYKTDYKGWKDKWIPIVTKEIEADIICGNRVIHMIFYKFPSFEFVNNILDKYCDWAQPKYKKGFKPIQECKSPIVNEFNEEIDIKTIKDISGRVRKLSQKDIDTLWHKCGWIDSERETHKALPPQKIKKIRESKKEAFQSIRNLLLETPLKDVFKNLKEIEKKLY